MSGTGIKTQAVEPEVQMPKPTYHELGTVEATAGSASVINWSETGLNADAVSTVLSKTLGFSVAHTHDAGGANTLAEDQNVIDAIVKVGDSPVASLRRTTFDRGCAHRRRQWRRGAGSPRRRERLVRAPGNPRRPLA